jgi:uncharacterized protein (DUF58 family)
MKLKFTARTKQTFIIPTRYGLLFFGFFVLMIITGATYQNNMVLVMAFLLFSVALIAMIQTHRNLVGLTVQTVFPEPGFAGTEGRARLKILNASNADRVRVHVQATDDGFHGPVDVIPGRQESVSFHSLRYLQRGVAKINKVRICTTYPYGLFFAWQNQSIDSEFVVYPEPKGFFPYKESKSGVGEDFSGHRTYRLGDSLRHVDWKANARGQPLLIKEFTDGDRQSFIFRLDQTHSSELEARLSELCSWICEAQRKNFRFSLELGDSAGELGEGSAHYHRSLRRLALFEGTNEN